MRAAALPSVLIVSTVMILMLLVLISAIDNLNAVSYNSVSRTQSRYNIESVVEILCHNTTFCQDSVIYPFPDDDDNVVSVKAEDYGLYKLLTLNSGVISKSVLIGSESGYKDSLTLWVNDNNRPLSLTAFTNIIGKLYCSPLGIAYNQVNSQYFSGERVGVENIIESGTELPAIKTSVTDMVDSLFLLHENSIVDIELPLDISDTILVARSVKIPENFVGEVQIFATDSVIIESNVHLNYPSGIYVKSDTTQCYVKIGEGSEVNGHIVVVAPEADRSNLRANYVQHQKAKMRGLLYIDGTAEVHGIISGKCFIRDLAIYTRQGIYTSILYNATLLDGGDIAYPLLLEECGDRKEVVKWIN